MAFLIKNNATGKFIVVDGQDVSEVRHAYLVEPFSAFKTARTVCNVLKNKYPELEIIEA